MLSLVLVSASVALIVGGCITIWIGRGPVPRRMVVVSNWTYEKRMIAVGDSPEWPMGAMVDRSRSVELIRVYNADGRSGPSGGHIFFLMLDGRRYPIVADHAVRKAHKKGGERGKSEWLITNDFTASAGDMSRLGFPPSRYPLATVGEDDALEVVRDMALEALCFFGRAGKSLAYLEEEEWCASYGDTTFSIDQFV